MSAPDLDVIRFRVKFYQGDRCWGAEHNQTADNVATLLQLWGDVAGPDERVVIEPANER